MSRGPRTTAVAVLALAAACAHAPPVVNAPPVTTVPMAVACDPPPATDSLVVAATGSDDSTLTIQARTACDAAITLTRWPLDARAGRDALDAGADVLVTSDPGALAYASRREELASVALPWMRRYVLVMRLGAPVLSDSESSALDSLRVALARDAVPADARPAPDDGADSTCATHVTAAAARADSVLRIAFTPGDPVARALAARLAALALRRGIDARLTSPDDSRATAIVLPTRVADRWCVRSEIVAPLAGPTVVVPLIEIRPHAIARPGVTIAMVGDTLVLTRDASAP